MKTCAVRSMPSSTELENLRASKRFITKCSRRKSFFSFLLPKLENTLLFLFYSGKLSYGHLVITTSLFCPGKTPVVFQVKTPLMVVNPVAPLIRPTATF